LRADIERWIPLIEILSPLAHIDPIEETLQVLVGTSIELNRLCGN